MRKTTYILLLAVAALLSACKQDNWIDWKAENLAFLEQNLHDDSVQITPSGLQYKVIRQGLPNAAPKPDELKSVVIAYKGSLINGYVFDSSDEKLFAVSNLVEGFSEGLKKMNVTGRYILYIRYDLGYGETGSGAEGTAAYIPPYSTLIFDVTLKQCF